MLRMTKFSIMSCLFMLLGCNSQRTSQTAVANHDVNSEFMHKLECSKLRKNAEDTAIQTSSELDAIYSVFYSAKMNSCLVAEYKLFPSKTGPESESLLIEDLFDQREVWSQYLPESKKYPEVEDMLDKQIEQLK
jgi:hypothetical protein